MYKYNCTGENSGLLGDLSGSGLGRSLYEQLLFCGVLQTLSRSHIKGNQYRCITGGKICTGNKIYGVR